MIVVNLPHVVFLLFFFLFALYKQAVLNIPTLRSNHCHFSAEQGQPQTKKAKPFTHNPTLRLSPSIKYFIIISMFIYKYTLHKDTIKFIQG